MKILLPSIGSRGDIQPYINLAQGLRDAGHDVTVTTHPCMQGLVRFHDLDFAPIGPDVNMDQEAARLRQNSFHWLIGFMKVMQFGYSLVTASSDDILKLAQNADLVIVSDSSAGSAEADKLGIPRIAVTLQPTRVPRRESNPSALQRISGKLLGAVMDSIITRPFNNHRKRLGLAKLGEEGIFSTLLSLVPVSPKVAQPDPLWPDYVHLTGYWFAKEPEDWSPPADLVAFLEAGEPPAIISLGAMSIGSSTDAHEASDIIIAAIQQTGLRAVIQGWNDVLDVASLPKNIYHAGSVPHRWLLPQGCCVAHHGGFGTTASGLRSGIPSIIVPHIIDQFLWGQEVEKLGVGPAPVPRKDLSVERFSQALIQATQDESIQRTAHRIGEQIRAEDGVGTAVQLIEKAMSEKRIADEITE
jgi:sterol 3beta-glucosyltransferase